MTPSSVQPGVTFELVALASAIRNEPLYARDGHAARTLVRSPDLRVVLVSIARGKRISEHRANATTLVHVLSGKIRLHLPDSTAELPAGQLLALRSDLPHDVVAEVESVFLLTLGHSDEGHP